MAAIAAVPAYIGQTAQQEAKAAPPAPAIRGLPAKHKLEYLKLALELLLLLLAVPWLLKELLNHPGQVSRRAAKHHLG